MTERELTYNNQSRYDGYMEPTADRDGGPQSNSSPMDQMKEQGRDLLARQERGEEESSDPPSGAEVSPEGFIQQGLKTEGQNKTTRERFREIARDLRHANSISDVHKLAYEVLGSARVLDRILQQGGNEELRKKFQDKDNLLKQAEEAFRNIAAANNLPEGEKPEQRERTRAVLGQAGTIARIADAIGPYFESAKIGPSVEELNPYKNIQSFEELMQNFLMSIGGSDEEQKFLPKEEFSLLDVKQYVDEFGRQMSEETAHPENFLRWIRERIWFYHDFDPMKDINLFQNLYLVAGVHRPNLYEMTVEFSTYFAHRKPHLTDLYVNVEDIRRVGNHFVPVGKPLEEGLEPGQVIGYYDNYIDPKTGNKTPAYARYLGQTRKGESIQVYTIETNEKGEKIEVPVQAWEQDKDKWSAVPDKGFDEIKNQIMYEMWLMTYNHNMDVAYRQNGMVTETELKKVMAELYSVNIWTRTRSRIWKMFNMYGTTHREGETSNEALEVMDEKRKHADAGKLDHQGSVGKGFQRATAAYYHTSESEALARGYKLDQGINPFKKLLRAKDGTDWSGLFYKSLVRQGLVREFGYGNKDKYIAAELVELLNGGEYIDLGVEQSNGSYRKRSDWEKVELYDVLFLDKDNLLKELARRKVTQQQLDRAVEILQKKYGQQSPSKIDDLNALFTLSARDKRERVLKNLKGEKGDQGIKPDMWKGGYMHSFIEDGNFEMFAPKFFAQSFPSSTIDFNPGINPFENISYSLEARDRYRQAMRDVLIHTEKLDEFEAKYAEEWAYTMTYYTGISARNDMGGIGHDAGTKIFHTLAYRLRQTSGGNYYGNLENLYGIQRLGVNFWEAMRVQPDGSNEYNKTLYEELVGLTQVGDGYDFDINKDMEGYEFYGNAMRQYVADHLGHAIDLFIDVTQKHELDLTKLTSEDGLGRLSVNHAEMQKLIDNTWKHLRYAYDNRSLLYDNVMYGWIFDEDVTKEGQIKRTPHFGMRTLRELMFSEKVRTMGMYERQDVSGWKPGTERTKMARNVFAYLISMQILEHRKKDSGVKLYSAEELSLIADAFVHYAARVMQGKDEMPVVLSGFFTPEEMHKIFIYGHAVLWWLFAKEYGEDITGGIFTAIFEALGLIVKEVGGSIKL